VDFIINVANAPQGVKQKLLGLPNSPFVQLAQMFFYTMSNGTRVQIDITPEWQVRNIMFLGPSQEFMGLTQ
jgi:hypothetical protein